MFGITDDSLIVGYEKKWSRPWYNTMQSAPDMQKEKPKTEQM